MVRTQRYNNNPPRGWKDELPDISSQSDIMWILWKDTAQFAHVEPSGLK